jgi:hypothetical protein
MEAGIECTHCRVLMTSWAAPGSTVRYWQCPFCGHTHSSAYGEVFRSGAGARVVGRRARAPGAGAPPQAADPDWTLLKARAVRWFARLEAEGRPAPAATRAHALYRPAAASAGRAAGRQR